MNFQPGDIIARKYRLDRVLGQGGMGVVIAATHVELEDRVALKFLLPGVAQSDEFVARFLREARAARQIQNEHVARVADVGRTDDGTPFMVMEYLDGCDLSSLLRSGPLAPATAARYVAQACEALAEAHALGIVHRDLKPANLFLTHRRNGSPCIKVLDFGISKVAATAGSTSMTRTSTVMGSPVYMSPEQIREVRTVDSRADVWALGVTLYELIAGHPPFRAEAFGELCAHILSVDPPPLGRVAPHVPPDLEAVVMRCLMRDSAARYANGGEVLSALLPFTGEADATAARPPVVRPTPAARAMGTTAPPLSNTRREETDDGSTVTRPRHARTWVFAAASLIIVIGAIALATRFRRDAAGPPNAQDGLTVAPATGVLDGRPAEHITAPETVEKKAPTPVTARGVEPEPSALDASSTPIATNAAAPPSLPPEHHAQKTSLRAVVEAKPIAMPPPDPKTKNAPAPATDRNPLKMPIQ